MRQDLIRIICCLVVGVYLFGGHVEADDKVSEPQPVELLRAARMASTSQQAALRGQLRAGKETMPFKLGMDYGKLRFDFENPKRVIEVRLNEDSTEVVDGRGHALKKGMQEEVLAGSGVTAEDLSLGFLYWPDTEMIGKEGVRGRSAWIIDLRPGKRGSEFAVVRVWLDCESGALLRIEGYDWEGRLLRRFEMVSGQKIDGQWLLKQMRIEKFGVEDAKRPTGRAYLEILGKDQT